MCLLWCDSRICWWSRIKYSVFLISGLTGMETPTFTLLSSFKLPISKRCQFLLMSDARLKSDGIWKRVQSIKYFLSCDSRRYSDAWEKEKDRLTMILSASYCCKLASLSNLAIQHSECECGTSHSILTTMICTHSLLSLSSPGDVWEEKFLDLMVH